MTTTISIENLIKTGAHFGHLTFKWHPKIRPYLYGSNRGAHIIDLRQTLTKLKDAYDFASKIGARGGKMMFIGTKPAAAEILRKYAQDTGNFYVVHRWLGGTLTNFQTIRQSIAKLNQIEEKAGQDLSYPGILKKEAVLMEKERQKMRKMLGGIMEMRKMPAAMFIVDLNLERIALQESKIMGIPTLAMVDTNANPTQVDYPIPSNDDSVQAIQMIASVIASGYAEGRALYMQKHSAVLEEEEGKEEVEEKAETPSPEPEVETT